MVFLYMVLGTENKTAGTAVFVCDSTAASPGCSAYHTAITPSFAKASRIHVRWLWLPVSFAYWWRGGNAPTRRPGCTRDDMTLPSWTSGGQPPGM